MATTDDEPQDSGLFAIEVDADDYAEDAANDTPSVPRTYQSEAAFQAIKKNYTARIHGPTSADTSTGTLEDLMNAVPSLQAAGTDGKHREVADGKVKLSKKDVQLLSYAVGELYYLRRYAEVIELCGRVRESCELDVKTEEAVGRWEKRAGERMEERNGNEG